MKLLDYFWYALAALCVIAAATGIVWGVVAIVRRHR